MRFIKIFIACIFFLVHGLYAQVYLDTAISFNEKVYSSEIIHGLDNGLIVLEKYLKIKAEVRTEVQFSILSNSLNTIKENKISFAGNYEQLVSTESDNLVYSIYKSKSQRDKIVVVNSSELSVYVVDAQDGLPAVKGADIIGCSGRLYYVSMIKRTPHLTVLNPDNGSFKTIPIEIEGYSSRDLKVVGVELTSQGNLLWNAFVRPAKGSSVVFFTTDLAGKHIRTYTLESETGRKMTDVRCLLKDDVMYVAGAFSDYFSSYQEGVFYGLNSGEGFELQFERLSEMPAIPDGLSHNGHRSKKDENGNKVEAFTIKVNSVFYNAGAVFYFDFFDPIFDTNLSVNYSSSNGTFNNSSISTLIGKKVTTTLVTKFDTSGKVWSESVPFNEKVHYDYASIFSRHHIENDSIFQLYLLGDYSISAAEFDAKGKTEKVQTFGVVDGNLESWNEWGSGYGLFYATEDINKPKGPIHKELVSIHFHGKTYQRAIKEAKQRENKKCSEDEVKQLLAGALGEFNDQDAMFQLEMERKIKHLAQVKEWSDDKEASYSLNLISTPTYQELFNKKLNRANEMLDLMSELINQGRSQCDIAEEIKDFLEESRVINKQEWDLVIAVLNKDLGEELKNVDLHNSLSEEESEIVGQYIDLDDPEYGIAFQANGIVYDIVDGLKTNSRTWKIEDKKLCFLSICLDFKYDQEVLSYSVFGEKLRFRRIK